MREARATLHESWKVMMRSSFFSLSKLSAPLLDQVVGELADVLRHRVARDRSQSNGPISVFQKL